MVMPGGPGPMSPHSLDPAAAPKVSAGTFRRVLPYARRYRWRLTVLVLATALSALIAAASPLILMVIIDDGILKHRLPVVVWLALAVVGLALLDGTASLIAARCSANVGQSLVCDLRVEVFDHVRRQPLAFFTRAQTGSLVSRLNTDVVGAQHALTLLLSETVALSLTLVATLVAMFALSWKITLLALLIMPLTILPSRLSGTRLRTLTREGMQRDANLAAMLNERFNVSGAMLAKLYGDSRRETATFAERADKVREVHGRIEVYGRLLVVASTLIVSLATALIYGFGGWLVIAGNLEIGGLVAMATLLLRLFIPLNGLANVQVHIMTALVSFDRIFELLDLKPLVVERPDAISLPAHAGCELTFDDVVFRYPGAREVSLASLENTAADRPEREDTGAVLNGISFTAAAGTTTALVGRSGAGKTTITHLVPRLYDPGAGAVRIGGHDLRELRLQSVQDLVGVVSQDAHLFHDTIRENLLFARAGADDRQLADACRAAHIWDTIEALPNGLDTVVGDHGYRLSGGEKQRIALARLLLKSPPVVVLDEPTAHLDSESEAAIQRALGTALAGRTALIIAHRLSTVRKADQILVVDEGRICERGTHAELLALDGHYAELYRTQFQGQAQDDGAARVGATAGASEGTPGSAR